jgi:uncharacterized protein
MTDLPDQARSADVPDDSTESASASTPAPPVPGNLLHQRDHFADELRGFALLGIAFVNAPFMAVSVQGFVDASVATWYDRTAAFLIFAFAQAKFYLLFSFLFGYSLHYIVKDDAPATARRFRWRLAGLAALGVAHAALLFTGDILFIYAVFGMALLVLRHKTDRAVLCTGIVAAMAWAAVWGALYWSFWNSSQVASSAASFGATADASAGGVGATVGAAIQAINSALQNANFWDATLARIAYWPWALLFGVLLNGLGVVALFCAGLVAGRRRVLSNPDTHPALWRNGLIWGLGVGMPIGVFSAWLAVGPGAQLNANSGLREFAGTAIGYLSAPFLTWGYASVLARQHINGAQFLAVFRPAGRMSLTVYLGESLLLSFTFAAYGLGYFGQMTAAGVAATALTGWIIMSIAAVLIQKRFESGPMEAVLRRISRL